MPKTVEMRRPRLQAQITGQAVEIGPTEARRRNIMAAARRVTSLERKAKDLTRRLKEVRSDLRFARKEFALLTQETEIKI